MYCITCGNELHPSANFCQKCGGRVRTTSAARPDSGMHADGSAPDVLTLTPVFVPWLALASAVPLQVFLSFWGALVIGTFVMFGLVALNPDLPRWVPYVICGAVLFLGIPVAVAIARMKAYSRTRYTFHADRLHYYAGIFSAEERSIAYENITEVTLRRGPLQKFCGLGTIVLSTPATTSNGTHARRIRISDVPDAESVYRQIKALIARS